jgi:hypothetical protein
MGEDGGEGVVIPFLRAGKERRGMAWLMKVYGNLLSIVKSPGDSLAIHREVREAKKAR